MIDCKREPEAQISLTNIILPHRFLLMASQQLTTCFTVKQYIYIYIHMYIYMKYIYTCLLLLISMLWHRQAIFESKGDKLSSSAECKLKTWTRLPVPMISEHSAHSTPLPVGIRTWLWRYTCSLLLISMLWHRQAIFESNGDNIHIVQQHL